MKAVVECQCCYVFVETTNADGKKTSAPIRHCDACRNGFHSADLNSSQESKHD